MSVPFDAQPRVPSIAWMFFCSLWLIPVVFGFGMTTWIGFALIGLLVLRVRWLVVSGVFAVAALLVTPHPGPQGISIMFGRFETGNLYADDAMLFIVYLAGVGYALHANRVWLRILWSRRERGVRMLWRGTARPPRVLDGAVWDADLVRNDASVSVPGADQLPERGSARASYEQRALQGFRELLAQKQAVTSQAAPRVIASTELPDYSMPLSVTSTPLPSTSFALPLGPLDVHTASVEELAGIPAIGLERAQALVAARASQPLSSLDEVAALLNLDAVALIRVRPYLRF